MSLAEPRMTTAGISPRINGAMRQDGEGAPELVVASSRPIPLGLTLLQRQIKTYLSRPEFQDGFSPTIREIAAALGCKGHGNIHIAVNELIARGHITRGPNRRRSLRVIQHCCPHCGGDLSAASVNPASKLEASS